MVPMFERMSSYTGKINIISSMEYYATQYTRERNNTIYRIEYVIQEKIIA